MSWIMNGQTVDGSVTVLGLSERGWRRLLDPGTVLLMAGLYGYHVRRREAIGRRGRRGFIVAEVGLATALIGNVIEFWIGEWLYVDVPGEFEPTDHIGWTVFGVGVIIATVGLGMLAFVSLVRALGGKDGAPSPP